MPDKPDGVTRKNAIWSSTVSGRPEESILITRSRTALLVAGNHNDAYNVDAFFQQRSLLAFLPEGHSDRWRVYPFGVMVTLTFSLESDVEKKRYLKSYEYIMVMTTNTLMMTR